MNQQWELNPENEMKHIIQRYSLKSHVNNIIHDYRNHSIQWNVSPLEFSSGVVYLLSIFYGISPKEKCN